MKTEMFITLTFIKQTSRQAGTSSVPAVSKKNCLSVCSLEGELANREAENVYSSSQSLENGLKIEANRPHLET